MTLDDFCTIHSRRSFFACCAGGIGMIAALAHLLAGRRPRRRRPARAQDSRTFRPRPRTSSSCSWKARRARWTCSIQSRRSQKMARPSAAAVADQGPETGLHQADRRGAGQPPQVYAVRPVRDRISDRLPHLATLRRRHLPGAIHVQRCLQPPSRPAAAVQRHIQVGRPTLGAWACMASGSESRESARLRGAHFRRGDQWRREQLLERIPALHLRRDGVPRDSGDPILYLSNPAGITPPRSAPAWTRFGI